ncbi:WXG100 family type VII secretion target [Psychromicrobium sp. YIM B11713]|uniref:WXG100 family type VII secretion target n=1 Tax=Psychromicrobium sp. YIM B11713 TaxID=3145233 RepID=UPI00374E6B10
MEGFIGANPQELRDFAKQVSNAAGLIRDQGNTLTATINSGRGWKGPDAAQFRQRWNSSQHPLLNNTADSLLDVAKTLNRNADEQEKASAVDGAGGSSGGGLLSTVMNIVGWGSTTIGLGLKIKDAYTFLFTEGGIAKGAEALAKGKSLLGGAGNLGSLSDEFLAASKFGKFARIAGVVGAPLAIFGGIHDMISPEHEGWRGGGDRVAGGLSVIAGGGSLLMAAGLLTNPVGIGIVVGAGLIAGGWALGNMIADSEWGKAAGRWIGNTASNIGHGVANVASDIGHGVANVASDVGKGIKNVASGVANVVKNPIKALGGLFG